MKPRAGLAALLALATGRALAARSDPTPVSRVVSLLKGLRDKSELEFKAEEQIYERFVCWGEKVIDTKTASNADAKARKESLESYIEDIKAGRIEFTGERARLEKELQELNKDIDNATSIRDEEHAQFTAAEAELEQGLEAVSAALDVLREVVEKHADGTALAQRSNAEEEADESLEGRAAAAERLNLAAKLGAKVLSKGDAIFLERLLSGQVQDPAKRASWKKLNRKATHRMSYKSRSSKIVGTLQEMLDSFEKNLVDAREREEEALRLFEKLMEAKKEQKDGAQEAIRHMAEETGARSMSQTEAQDEVDALTEQMEKDTGFIEQVEEELRNKKSEWKERKALRTEEIAAFSKAIAILYSDDARDLAKRSYASQGYLLLQELRTSRARGASAALQAAASAAGGSARLLALAARLGGRGPFTEVMGAIDEMVATLKEEQITDVKRKEQCEAERMEDTRQAAKLSRAMDEATDVIVRLEGEIGDVVSEINEKNATKAAVAEALAGAEKQRAAEHAEWEKSDTDDAEMADVVQRATEVLQEFYSSKNLMLAQKKQEPQAAPGEAPIAPPKTWDGDYKGNTQQATGVIAALENAKADIEKDRSAAKAAEDESEAAFQEFKTKSEEEMGALDSSMSELTGTKGEKEGAVSEQKSDRLEKHGNLEAVLEAIAAANPGCIYMTVNYPVRLRNRYIEMDGLTKAKAILGGAKFDGLPDPDREYVPGDALLQGKRRL